MTSAPFLAGDREPRSSAGRLRRLAGALGARPLLVALSIIAVAVAIRAQGTVDADVAWQLWIGRQLNNGAHLYRDILETNPPLWFWMAMPVDWLSSLVHVRSDHLLIALVDCAAALSIIATDRLIGVVAPQRRALFLGYAALTLVAMPWVEIGQREHLALIGAIPYAALVSARRGARPVPVALAIAIGLGSAFGFALKHYFLIVPVLLELWLVAGVGKKWRPLRPETLAIASVGAVYAAAMLLAAQDYFTNVVPMLLLAYGATGAKRLIDLFQPAVLTALASILLLLVARKSVRSESSGIAGGLLVAAIGFTIVYFVQAKGWSYHAVPMLGCGALALAAVVIFGGNASRLMIFTAPALLLLPLWIAAQHAERVPESTHDVALAVTGMKPGETVGLISADPSFGWPAVLDRGLRFPLRYNGFWMMQAVVSNEVHGGKRPRLTKLGHTIVQQTVADFECTPPRRILVARPSDAAARAGDFDILAFFLRDPQFARLLAHYRPVQRTTVEVFEQVSALDRRADCPRWSPA